MHKYICLILFSLMGSACNKQQPISTVNSIVIENSSKSRISDVTINVPKMSGKIACNYIPPQGKCAVKVPPRQDQKNMVYLSWKAKGRSYKLDLRKAVKHYEQTENMLTVLVQIQESGNVSSAVYDATNQLP